MKDDTKVTKVKFSPQGGMNSFFVDDHKHPANGSPGICYLFKDKIQWDPQAVLANYLSSLKREHFLHSIMCVCARACIHIPMHSTAGSQRTAYGSQFSPSTIGVPGIKLGSSLMKSAFLSHLINTKEKILDCKSGTPSKLW